MSEIPITPVRLSPEDRSLAEQISEQVSGEPKLAAGIRIALRAEAARRGITPREVDKRG